MHRPIADITPLSHLGVLAVRGVEARKFLGGQLSQDVLALAADR
ncbi:MAG: folate-binding protein, partial [Gammaproteobacteria bacterium]|nr:folate-binding protein [Gammaproteobacteria bacterium]